MRSPHRAFGAVVLVAALCCPAAALRGRPAQSPQQKMTAEEETWLEDVSPIITKVEREVFLKLRTGPERQKFIHFFWRVRDPAPDTSENEFQREYYERIRFADKNFGHYSPKRGSRTDRGYFYVLLGPPLERTLYTTQSEIWPLELWFYRGAGEYGLPDYFYLIFYQPEGIGDFRLYSPSIDGPEKLVLPQASLDSVTRSSAMTAQAPASSAILACSGVTTSMMTPPLSICASPFFTAKVPVCSSIISSLLISNRW